MKKSIVMSLISTLALFGADVTNSIGMVFNEMPHSATVKSFYMGETEVTQAQWKTIMGNNPSYGQTSNLNQPVEDISWDEAQAFIQKLNVKEGTKAYRLPTQEEWEYAARAGSTTLFSCGNDESCLSNIAVFDRTDSAKAVKSKKPNRWGLYDMSGNVWEWTSSCWHTPNTQDCKYRAIRGGGWHDSGANLQLTSAFGGKPIHKDVNIGFRVAKSK